MPIDKLIKIESLQWQICKNYPNDIGSIGITLANGSSSPIFTGLKKQFLGEIKEIKITEQIKTIVGKNTLILQDFFETYRLKIIRIRV